MRRLHLSLPGIVFSMFKAILVTFNAQVEWISTTNSMALAISQIKPSKLSVPDERVREPVLKKLQLKTHDYHGPKGIE